MSSPGNSPSTNRRTSDPRTPSKRRKTLPSLTQSSPSKSPSKPKQPFPLNLFTRKRKLEQEISEAEQVVNERVTKIAKPDITNEKHVYQIVSFWASCEDLAFAKSHHSSLRAKHLEVEHSINNPSSDWQSTGIGQEIQRVRVINDTQARVFAEQVKENQKKPQSFEELKKSNWLQLWLSSHLGLDRNLTVKKNDKSQMVFSRELSKVADSRHPTQKTFRCPITRGYYPRSFMAAAHLFPSRSGQSTMSVLFGTENELYSPLNGMYMNREAEEFLDKCYYTIIPDVSDLSSASWEKWRTSNPKEYKIKILSQDSKFLDEQIPIMKGDTDTKEAKTWRQLDGQRLQFSSEYRPRARYLYYCYCYAILICAYHAKEKRRDDRPLREDVGRPYWGTGGSYMRAAYITALAKHVGQKYEGYLGGKGEGEGSDVTNPELILSLTDRAGEQEEEEEKGGPEDEDSDVEMTDRP